jgi:lipopolysaccharide/colanic/teichoic acid biosynthesis glycosyltransferase
MRKSFIIILLDLLIVFGSFLVIAWLMPGTISRVIPQYYKSFLFFLMVWYVTSFVNGKYSIKKYDQLPRIILRILLANFIIIAIITVLLYVFNLFFYSRYLVLGVIGLASVSELIFFYLLNAILNAVSIDIDEDDTSEFSEKIELRKKKKKTTEFTNYVATVSHHRKKALDTAFRLIREENGDQVYDFIYNNVLLVKSTVRIVSTTTRFNIYALEHAHYGGIVNMQRINDIKRINKFFEAVNSKLLMGGVFIGKVETYVLHKMKILSKFPFPLNYLIYIIDFIVSRIWPKLPLFNRLYFALTQGHNRVISMAETLGRLCSCGFEIVNHQFINNELYFVVTKISEPHFPERASYGPLITLRRIGRHGKYFNVYKLRTMHPYSEFLQEYVYEKNSLQEGGKIKDDFRVTTLGKFFRKFWIDELPMFINVVKGEMKIVGVRPLSEHYYNLYSEELKQRRIKFKPGLVPPFYVDMPVTLEEIMASESRYLDQHEKSPFMTDFRYFFRAFYNIFFKKARSH